MLDDTRRVFNTVFTHVANPSFLPAPHLSRCTFWKATSAKTPPFRVGFISMNAKSDYMLVLRKKYLWILRMKQFEARMFLFKCGVFCRCISFEVRIFRLQCRYFFGCLYFIVAKGYIKFLIALNKLGIR